MGEVCVVTNKKQLRGKLNDRGAFGIMVSYSENHVVGTYCIFLLDTMRTINTTDVKWLDMYFGTLLESTEGITNDPDLRNKDFVEDKDFREDNHDDDGDDSFFIC